MKSSRIILALMLVAIMVSVICVSVSAATYLDSLEAVNGATVTLDGVNDATVTVAVASTSAMNVYGVEGSWSLADAENSGKITLTALGSEVMTFAGMNYVDVPTGKVMWTDDTFSAPAVLADGTKVLTATYTIAKDTPAGTYTVKYTSALLTADDYNNDQTEKVFTCTITVVAHEHVSNAAHPCQDGTCSCGQAMPATAAHDYDYDCDKNCKTCGAETRPDAAHNFTSEYACQQQTCSYCGTPSSAAPSGHVSNAAHPCLDGVCECGEPMPATAAHSYNYDCDKNCKVCGTETRPDAEHTYNYACDPFCSECNELTNPSATHDLTHHEAKKGTDCQTWDGNVEYWECEYCGGCWDNENAMYAPLNSQSVKANGDHVYTADCDTICDLCEEETRQSDVAHEYNYECDKFCKNCGEETNPDAEHSITHHEAVPGTDCVTWDGMLEYWSCDFCGCCWMDENLTQQTNRMWLVTNGAHSPIYVEAKPATEEADGNIEYWYCEICGCYFADEDCTQEISEEDTIVTYVPDTADAATLIPAVVLGMLAVTGAAILVSKKDLLK